MENNFLNDTMIETYFIKSLTNIFDISSDYFFYSDNEEILNFLEKNNLIYKVLKDLNIHNIEFLEYEDFENNSDTVIYHISEYLHNNFSKTQLLDFLTLNSGIDENIMFEIFLEYFVLTQSYQDKISNISFNDITNLYFHTNEVNYSKRIHEFIIDNAFDNRFNIKDLKNIF